MASVQREGVKGVLNETTMTVHKHEMGTAYLQTMCGHTHQVAHEQLRIVGIKRATEELGADKCGQCFEDGKGY